MTADVDRLEQRALAEASEVAAAQEPPTFPAENPDSEAETCINAPHRPPRPGENGPCPGCGTTMGRPGPVALHEGGLWE
jgi:hypothetical protein